MFPIFVASKLINQSTTTNLKLINMRTDYELVGALRVMYCFLGGSGCMQCSSDSIAPHFNCGFNSDNKVLIDAIVKAATGQRKQVSCEYSGRVVNIRVAF